LVRDRVRRGSACNSIRGISSSGGGSCRSFRARSPRTGRPRGNRMRSLACRSRGRVRGVSPADLTGPPDRAACERRSERFRGKPARSGTENSAEPAGSTSHSDDLRVWCFIAAGFGGGAETPGGNDAHEQRAETTVRVAADKRGTERAGIGGWNGRIMGGADRLDGGTRGRAAGL